MCAKRVAKVSRARKGATKVVKCVSCAGTGVMWTGASHTGRPMVDKHGATVKCCYCLGARKRTITVVDRSHRMSKWRSEVIAPCGTPRFYSVRHCTKCKREEWEHAAGHFFHGLEFPCKGLSSEEIERE